MFASLRSRLWLSYALMIATALVVVALVLMLYLIGNPLLHRQTLSRLRAAESLVMERHHGGMHGWDGAELTQIADSLDVRILVFGADHQPRVDTSADAAGLPFPRRMPRPRAVPTIQDAAGGFWLYTLSPLDGGESLMITAPRPKVPFLSVFADELLVPLLQGAVIALLLSLVLAFAFARWIADPLQRLVSAASGYPAMEGKAVEAGGPREVRELTRAFNSMMERVRASHRSQREFVANVSHELKTPLTSVSGFAQALLDGTAASAEDRSRAATVILGESGRMHRLVVDLLDLARLESGTAELRMEPVDAGALLRGVAERVKPQAEEAGIRIDVQAAADLGPITADRDRLDQVFLNLIENALHFSAAGGEVQLRAIRDGDEIVFEVEDAGRGIPADSVSRIFERFYQVDPARSGGAAHGSGLGLAIVQEIVQAHGGKISVRSQLERGTKITLRFPVVPPRR